MELRGKRALVTGGAGLIGSHITDQLLAQGIGSVAILDNFTRGRMQNLEGALGDPRLELIRGDIRDREAVARATEGADMVFHQAAIRITQCAEDPRLALEVMVEGTFNVLEAAVKAGVNKVVAASSASVYGLADEFPTTERQHPYNNRTIYGAAKAFDEGLLRSFNDMYGLSYVALRYFNVYGPRMDVFGVYTEVMVRWMERIANGEPPIILGDGAQTMDFVYAEDIARANLLAARAEVSDQVFNIASGEETSLSELASLLALAMGSDLQPVHEPARKVNPVNRRLASTDAAAREIGFRAEVGLEEGLSRLVAWWRAERERS